MQRQGIDPVIRCIDIEYLTPLRLGDDMVSCLNLSREGARFVFHQDIYTLPDRQPVIRATATVVCLRDGRLTRGDELAREFGRFLK